MSLKSAIVVGGSRGIGLAIATKFVQRGINVTLVSRNNDTLLAGVETLKNIVQNQKSPVEIAYKVCDVSNESDINQACKELIATSTESKQSIDILVNSAGVTFNKLLLVSSSENLHHILNTNLVGTILFTKLISRQMIKQKSGSIINIGSIVGQHGNPGQTFYAASKSALIGFSKSLAKELGPKGITVNVISPGFIETDMTSGSISPAQLDYLQKTIPLQRIGKAEEVASVAAFLASSSYITGEVLTVDGGLSLTL